MKMKTKPPDGGFHFSFYSLCIVTPNLKTVCSASAIAALLQGWLLCGGCCVPCKCAAMCGGLLGTLD